jgi:transcriptional regulator NrdR family protein
VTDSRGTSRGSTIRRRVCGTCGFRYSTEEIWVNLLEELPPAHQQTDSLAPPAQANLLKVKRAVHEHKPVVES